MLRFFLILQILCLFSNAYCQSTKNGINDKTDLRVEYDIEHIKISETKRINNKTEYTKYFTRCGDSISVYDWNINISVINKIKERILENFVINEFTEASGSAVLLLILDFENNVYEIRVIRGITQGFNKELLRVVNTLEKDLIFTCIADHKTPIVIPFSIRFNN